MLNMKCKKGRTITVLRSGAGYYIGTLDFDGAPYCRLSTGYAKTEEEALKVLQCDRGYASEVKFCNGGTGCLSFGGGLS